LSINYELSGVTFPASGCCQFIHFFVKRCCIPRNQVVPKCIMHTELKIAIFSSDRAPDSGISCYFQIWPPIGKWATIWKPLLLAIFCLILMGKYQNFFFINGIEQTRLETVVVSPLPHFDQEFTSPNFSGYILFLKSRITFQWYYNLDGHPFWWDPSVRRGSIPYIIPNYRHLLRLW